MSILLKHPISCSYSGVRIGTLEYLTTAGHTPYISYWNEMVAHHSIFSLSTVKLLAYARGEFNRLAARAEDSETTATENEILQVCFLAVLHSLGSIRQEAPALPPLHIVQTNMPRLFTLAYWKFHLDSHRFAFPEFKINRANNTDRFENIGYYLDACFEHRTAYSKAMDDIVEAEKVKSAERAMSALRNSWVTPTSKKTLYQWVEAHMPTMYAADAAGWMKTLFLGNDAKVLAFDIDETDLMQQIIEGECPPGTGIMHAVRKRIEEIRTIQTDHREAFTVSFEGYEAEQTIDDAGQVQTVLLPEPKQEQFATRGQFLKARAIWYLQQRAEEDRVAKQGKMPPALPVSKLQRAIDDDSTDGEL